MLNERYCRLLYMTMITLDTVSMANITITNEKPGAILRGIENNNLSLECIFNGVNIRKTILWRHNDRVVAVGRSGYVAYSFIPTKKDHLSEFCCQVHDAKKENIIEKVITLHIRYKPVLEFNFPDERHFIKGETNRLCCSSNSRPSTKTMWLFKDQNVTKEAHLTSSICLTLMNISDSDGGKYSCIAENEIGKDRKGINFTVLYPPIMEKQYIHFSKDEVLRQLQCFPEGVPNRFTFGRWEHRSYFNEHIRYLNSTSNGKLLLPILKNTTSKFDDSGIYVCNASNGVPDPHGNVFQYGELFVVWKGPPVFVEENKIIQFGKLRDNIKLKVVVVVHNVSSIECSHIEEENSIHLRHDIEMSPKNTTHVFHGTNTTIEGLEIVISLAVLQKRDNKKYKITLCNHHGNSSLIVESKCMNTETERPRVLGFGVIVLSLLTSILIISGIVVALVKRLRNKRIQTSDKAIEVVEGGAESVENVLYQSNTFRFNEAIHRSTLSEHATGSTSQRTDSSNAENQRPQILSNSFQVPTRQLNYADITFKPSIPGNEMRIIGIENKTVYADVDLTHVQTEVLNTPNELNGDDEDFVQIEDLDTLNESNSDDEDFVEIEDLAIFSHIKNKINDV
ncbi:hemicentin-1-like isoform X2 [Mytilus californianus]|uniref:hemicentin-1-like isoform X1 n=1 Tax=Mytilus californianus TaxID=6549 RepID=UPI002246D415|nr:hemicentin-1-like isoform X1 [Mytilus californianus]XP_052080103.1 hemicentin-1-like isoform X2 [Mytilus californianus]